MDEKAIFAVVKKHVLEILPEIAPEEVTESCCLKDLGANSIDRVEVAVYSMQELRIAVPPQELGTTASLKDLVRVLLRHAS
jgi:polyketide biosynthesis acyl carrier protein